MMSLAGLLGVAWRTALPPRPLTRRRPLQLALYVPPVDSVEEGLVITQDPN